jgi:hypothetical protein
MGINELLINLNSGNMKELFEIFNKDIEVEKFDKCDVVVFGVIIPTVFIALCFVVSIFK